MHAVLIVNDMSELIGAVEEVPVKALVLNPEGLEAWKFHPARLENALTHNTTLASLTFNAPALFSDIKKSYVSDCVAAALKTNKTLRKLELIRMGIGPYECRALSIMLKANETLTYLDLSKNSVSSTGASDLAEVLRVNATLETLILDGNQLGDTGCVMISGALKANEMLSSLSLVNVGMGKAGVFRMAEALNSFNSALTSLDMSIPYTGFYIGLEEAKHITAALTGNTRLTELKWNGCSFNTNVAIVFAEMLKVNATLRVLELGSSNFSLASARFLAQALQINTTLKWLELRKNSLSGEGVATLCDALLENKTLLYIGLDSNRCKGHNCTRAIEKLLKTNKTLTSISLRMNPFQTLEVVDIRNALASNTVVTSFQIGEEAVQDEFDAITAANLHQKQEVFAHTIDSNAMAPWSRSKLMFVGEAQAGKTQTIRSLLGKNFNPEWSSTIGVDLSGVKMYGGAGRWQTVEEQSHLVQVATRFLAEEDTGFNDLIATERPNVSRQRSQVLRHEDTELRRSERMDTLETTTPILEDEDVIREAHAYKDEWLMNAGAEGSLLLSIWDYGGQNVFHTLHHLFLTPNAVYTVVFDLCSFFYSKNSDSEKSLSFWLKAIELHAPLSPIIVVGTHADQVSYDAYQDPTSAPNKALKRLLGNNKQVVQPTGDLIERWSMYVPISNKDKLGIEGLRALIEATTMEQPFIHEKVQIRWIRGLDMLLSYRSKNDWLDFNSFRAMMSPIGVTSVKEMEAMLALFHDKGLIMYFDATQKLKSTIIINPQWLIKQVSMIIRDRKEHSYDETILLAVGLFEDAINLFEYGLISLDLLHYLWRKDQVEYLTELMQQLMLMSPWKFDPTEVFYLIPAMVVSRNPYEVVDGPEFRFEFQSLPYGVFERLVCLCVNYASGKEVVQPLVNQLDAHLWFSESNAVHIRHLVEDDTISVVVEVEEEALANLHLFEVMMKKIKTDIMGIGLEWELLVLDGNQFIPFANAKKAQLSTWSRTTQPVGALTDASFDNFLP